MLSLTIPSMEYFDEKTNTFLTIPGGTIRLEHSLVAISKWEAKWKKPFLGKDDKTKEEMLDYIRCMTITQNVNPNIYNNLTDENIKMISAYIDDPMTATWFSEKQPAGGNGEIVTSELIYYWMIAQQIPIEFQKWHLNRLLTLIRVCSIKNTPAKKMPKRDVYARNASLNAARRKALHSKG